MLPQTSPIKRNLGWGEACQAHKAWQICHLNVLMRSITLGLFTSWIVNKSSVTIYYKFRIAYLILF